MRKRIIDQMKFLLSTFPSEKYGEMKLNLKKRRRRILSDILNLCWIYFGGKWYRGNLKICPIVHPFLQYIGRIFFLIFLGKMDQKSQ